MMFFYIKKNHVLGSTNGQFVENKVEKEKVLALC